jgi:hypothetical protein
MEAFLETDSYARMRNKNRRKIVLVSSLFSVILFIKNLNHPLEL